MRYYIRQNNRVITFTTRAAAIIAYVLLMDAGCKSLRLRCKY